jgi:hypothetical protein
LYQRKLSRSCENIMKVNKISAKLILNQIAYGTPFLFSDNYEESMAQVRKYDPVLSTISEEEWKSIKMQFDKKELMKIWSDWKNS